MTDFKRIADMPAEIDFSVIIETGDVSAIEEMRIKQFLNADQMPKDVIGNGDFAGKTPLEIYTALGFTFPEKPDTTDPDFMDAKLPAGWHKQMSSTDPRSRKINVLDETGKKRITIWYKATPLDRCATAYIVESEN